MGNKVKSFLISTLLLVSGGAFAQTAGKAKSPQAVIKTDLAFVYKEASFDAPVLTQVRAGKRYEVSQKKFNGIFHRIRLKPGVVGFIADSDLILRGARNQEAKARDEEAVDRRRKSSSNRPFAYSQYAGLSYNSLAYQEKTMGSTQKENLGVYGVKLFGPDLVIDGPLITELHLQIFPGAPNYYRKKTGNPASGFLFLTDMKFISPLMTRKESLTWFGFGPMMRWNAFNVQLTEAGGKKNSFSLNDMALGVVFSLGAGVKFDKLALRIEGAYYWEEKTYLGLVSSLQFGF